MYCGIYYDKHDRASHIKTPEHIQSLVKYKNSIRCDCGGYYTLQHRVRHFKSEQHQNYLLNTGKTTQLEVSDNSDDNELPKNSIKCECGSHYTLNHRARHFKSKRHLDFINGIQSEDLIECECGGRYKFEERAEHFESTIHLNYLEKNNNKVRTPDMYECAACNQLVYYCNKEKHIKGDRHIKNLCYTLPIFVQYQHE